MLRELIEDMCCALVDNEDAVVVKETTVDRVMVLDITVADDDFGKLIGKTGAHAKALRVFAKSAGRKLRFDVHINIMDPKRPRHR